MLTLDHVFKRLRIRQNSGVSRSEEDPLITPEIIAEEVDTEQYPSLYPPGNVVFIHKTNHDRTYVRLYFSKKENRDGKRKKKGYVRYQVIMSRNI